MLGPSMMLIGTPAALVYAARAAWRAPDRLLAVLALLAALGESVALTVLLAPMFWR